MVAEVTLCSQYTAFYKCVCVETTNVLLSWPTLERSGANLRWETYFEVWRSEKKVPQGSVRCPCLSFGAWLDLLIGGCLNRKT